MTEIKNPFEVIELRLSNIESILDDIKTKNSESNLPHDMVEDIGNISLAVKITGLAKPTIYALVSQSKIPYMKKSKRLYFSREELTSWIKDGKRKTNGEKDLILKLPARKKTNKNS
jgi:hypothetical protein